METALAVHRFHFAFTVAYHYLFPQLTMGLAMLIFVMKSLALRTGNEEWNKAARFWTRLFAINFVMGVVTGIPMEFQFGTNWSRFAEFAGGVIGQTLAMEGVFAFFMESSFLGLLLFGEKKLGPKGHWVAALLVFLGSWLSGYFIVMTNAWMQHPRGYEVMESGRVALTSLPALLLNPWGLIQYAHVMMGTVLTASIFVSATGAFYLLQGRDREQGRSFLRLAVPFGLAASIFLAVPTGDLHAKMVARHQPAALAAMEGLFRSEEGAPLVLVGQPDVENRRLDNPIYVPKMLSFLTFSRFQALVPGLNEFPEEDWPDNISLLYYAYHIMVGLGTFFILFHLLGFVQLRRGRLFESRWMLWVLMLLFPFPYIANTTGWMTAELGRQPWLVHGLLRTQVGYSDNVSAGNGLFTLVGFMGMYTLLTILFLMLMWREIHRGPEATGAH
jgi:cytochrome d ubiquinol oxidase subunit I